MMNIGPMELLIIAGIVLCSAVLVAAVVVGVVLIARRGGSRPEG